MVKGESAAIGSRVCNVMSLSGRGPKCERSMHPVGKECFSKRLSLEQGVSSTAQGMRTVVGYRLRQGLKEGDVVKGGGKSKRKWKEAEVVWVEEARTVGKGE